MQFTAMVAHRYSEFRFDGKPNERVRTCLKGHGYTWNPRAMVWWKPAATGYADCITGLGLLGCQLTGKIEHGGPDSFDMAYEDECARQCGL